MAKLINLVEGVISFTLKFLEKSKEDPSFDAEKYLKNKYSISKICASRFYRPVYWTIFSSTANNHIGKIEDNNSKVEYIIKKSPPAEEISNISNKIIKEYKEYYKSNAEADNFHLEI